MRIHKLATYLNAEEAYTLIEFLDQVRDMLMQTYGEEITTMLQQASAPQASISGDEVPF